MESRSGELRAMYDVVALGELLIDFTPAGRSKNGNQLFECNPGGAPANVLACLAMLGKKTRFIGKVGDDQFGHFLRDVLTEKGICTKGLVLDAEANTTLAFVHLREDGDRSFSFYRKPGADTRLQPEEIDEVLRRRKDLEAWTATELESSVRFANAIGALVTTRKGGIPAMPSLQEVEGFLANYPK